MSEADRGAGTTRGSVQARFPQALAPPALVFGHALVRRSDYTNRPYYCRTSSAAVYSLYPPAGAVLLKHWGLPKLRGLSDEAESARAEVLALLDGLGAARRSVEEERDSASRARTIRVDLRRPRPP